MNAIERAVLDVLDAGRGPRPRQALLSLWHPDCVVHLDGRSKWGGVHTGLDAALAVVQGMHSVCEGRLQLTTEAVIADDRFAVVQAKIEAHRRDAASLRDRLISVWRLEKGRVVEAWHHLSDLAAWDRFWVEGIGESQPDRSELAYDAAQYQQMVRRINDHRDNSPLREFYSPDLVPHPGSEGTRTWNHSSTASPAWSS